MAILTNTEQLISVQTAIQAIENGAQEYWVGQRKCRRADLRWLYVREERLSRERLSRIVQSETAGTSMTSIGVMDYE
jgi:hypothetical protein